MNARQLIAELQKYDGDLPVGCSGHFGELDCEVDGVSLKKCGDYRERITFLSLDGMPASYEEPD